MILRNVTFYFILAVIFLFGGTLQFVGIISNTVCSYIIALIILFSLFINGEKLIFTNNYPDIILVIVILTSCLLNSTSLSLTLLYIISFIIVRLSISAYTYNKLLRFINVQKLLNFFLIVGIIQMPIILLQNKFGSLITALSVRKLAIEDVAFGTFFFGDDHALGFLLNSLVVYILFEKPSIKPFWKLFFVFWYSITLLLANSNISVIILCSILIFYFIFKLGFFKSFLTIGTILSVFILLCSFLPLADIVNTKFTYIENKVLNNNLSYNESAERIKNGVDERSDIAVYFLNRPLKVIGEGPYNYFNPVKGEFRKFMNFSQYLWFYNDLGIIGMFSVILIYVSFYKNFRDFNNYSVLYLYMILIYSFMTNTLSDLAFNLIFTFFVLKDIKSKLSVNQTDENANLITATNYP